MFKKDIITPIAQLHEIDVEDYGRIRVQPGKKKNVVIDVKSG